MGIAVLASHRSKDPEMKVGACLVSADGKIIGVGYNGHPKVREELDNDQLYPWTKNLENYEKNKHKYVCHAELNAIVHSSGSVKGSSLYVTLNPCNECAKLIVQSGIKEVIWLCKKTFRDNALEAAMKIFRYSHLDGHVKQFNEFIKDKYGIKAMDSIQLDLKYVDHDEK